MTEKPDDKSEEPAVEAKKAAVEIQKPGDEIKEPIVAIEKPTVDIQKPTDEIKEPVVEIEEPAAEIKKPVIEIKKDAAKRPKKARRWFQPRPRCVDVLAVATLAVVAWYTTTF
jgi:hypothetical protein